MILAGLMLIAEPPAEPLIDGPPLDWATDHAPFGMDITLDGKLWINTNKVGARDDYAILANDLYRSLTNRSAFPRVWIRGYHRKNSTVTYRETKALVEIDCMADTIRVERRVYYSASGETVGSEGPFAADPIVPGSIGESWRKAACTKFSK
ncbi:surface-adhesin E family protein [Sphingomonas alba]|uniref:Surface-adhesin protein E-like domain-containing protein n=1 Tax=Sphingomonas alba TaxID=2908208 RepID=A0ABT0RPQ3_9SPHN|nr:surface-adhesin E family protein [Sphingomonas alba]MCL6684465.1 hypothetical protein [Sphingomonas alba]